MTLRYQTGRVLQERQLELLSKTRKEHPPELDASFVDSPWSEVYETGASSDLTKMDLGGL